ncbi:TonB-dependent receptor domain-containing protein [Polluticoccus soli]|uniref:TonB-dependent receptor domain-containing protein n=1 Tax=Polluticoccus soli TaxID=3034150 RepID=UPI0023E17DDC|nr:TonB-dependent receptor [Flavipsychrobacter sp. JY13-12]
MYAIRSIVAALVLICPLLAFAQTQEKPGKISGKIINELKKPVEYATVTLLRKDSTVANGGLTDESGSFSIEQTGTGDFLLRVSGIGFTTRTVNNISITPAALEKKMGTIEVASSSRSLKQVEVTAERAMIEMTAEKKVFNVEKNITSSGGSAADVLQNVPSLTIDADGDVLLRGKETTLLIDGKPATLLAGDIATALQSLPGASIQSVEVITNPSAKYDAQGMSGIINIITKKDKKMGFNGSVTAGAGTHDKYNGGINLNLKNDKWNIFLNSNFRSNRNYQRNTTNRINIDSTYFNTFEDNIREFGGFFNTIGAEYSIDQKNTVTLTQNLNRMRWGGHGTSEFNKFEQPIQIRSFEQVGGPFSTSTSLDYKHKFAKPAQELTTNVTYAQMWVTRTQTYHTTSFDSNGSELPTVFQNAPGQGGNRSLNAQADFTTPFLTKTGRLDAGLKTQLFWFYSDNDPKIDTLDDGKDQQTDSLLLNNYDYTQHVHAAYGSFSDQHKNWSYNAGLRLEYATYEGTSLALKGNKFTNDYLGLFPSAFVSYKLPKEQAVNLSYTRRTNRPGFMQLMPYVDISNPQDTSMGNPELIPEFIHNTELSYNRQIKGGHSLMASVYYQYTQNLIERVRTFYEDNGTSFSQPQNLNHGTTYGLELTGRTQILPIWDLTANANFFRNEVSGTNVDNSGYSWFAKMNTNLRLPAGFALQVNGNYEAPKVGVQGIQQEVYWLDIALRKNLLNNRATLVLNVSDILNTRKYTTVYDQGTFRQDVYRDKETRIGNVTFTYRFGKSEQKAPAGGRRGKNNAPVPQKDRNNLKTDDNSEQAGF